MSDLSSAKELLAARSEGAWRERVERAERLAHRAEVDLLDTQRRVRVLEEYLGEARTLLREAQDQLAEAIDERDAWRKRAEHQSQLLVVR